MPIGASKVGALGGLVPGGSVTFNTSGTFSVPPGVKLVSITGVGSAGNPGTSGTPGNPGNIGFGGGGGGGGSSNMGAGPGQPAGCGTNGGNAWSATANTISGPGASGGQKGWRSGISPACQYPVFGNPGQNGGSGSAGSAGSAGCAGTPGQCSSGLGNNFAGGAGGNAGAAGNAGNGGSGGQGGARGLPAPSPQSGNNSQGGSGGNGGGAGSTSLSLNARPSAAFNSPPFIAASWGGAGGGGAGATNDGTAGTNCGVVRVLSGLPNYGAVPKAGAGGTTSNYSVPLCSGTWNPPGGVANTRAPCINGPTNVNTTGSPGRVVANWSMNPPYVMADRGNVNPGAFAIGGGQSCFLRNPNNQPGVNIFCYSPNQAAYNAVRSGGGGGRGGRGQIFTGSPTACFLAQNINKGGGGAGGGGRGNAGNAGGTGGAGGCGAAGTPATFNCIPVTPGGCYPITVAAPGGQIVISWNPQ